MLSLEWSKKLKEAGASQVLENCDYCYYQNLPDNWNVVRFSDVYAGHKANHPERYIKIPTTDELLEMVRDEAEEKCYDPDDNIDVDYVTVELAYNRSATGCHEAVVCYKPLGIDEMRIFKSAHADTPAEALARLILMVKGE